MANTPKKSVAKSSTPAKNPAAKPKPKAAEPAVKHTTSLTDRPKLKRGKTHSGQRAAEIVVRPALNVVREEADTAVVAWGRMNPPTIGHLRLVEAVSSKAAELGGYPMLFLSKTMNERNPLSLNERLDLVTDAFGDMVHIEEAAEVTDPITLLKYVSEDFKNVVVVTGPEHAADYSRFFETYNGKEFNFDSMNLVVLGRDEKASQLEESISATQMRKWALEGASDLFESGLPQALKMDSEHIMEMVRYGMSLQEAAASDNPATRAIVAYRNKRV